MAAGSLRFVRVIWARPGPRGSDDQRIPGRARSLQAPPAPPGARSRTERVDQSLGRQYGPPTPLVNVRCVRGRVRLGPPGCDPAKPFRESVLLDNGDGCQEMGEPGRGRSAEGDHRCGHPPDLQVGSVVAQVEAPSPSSQSGEGSQLGPGRFRSCPGAVSGDGPAVRLGLTCQSALAEQRLGADGAHVPAGRARGRAEVTAGADNRASRGEPATQELVEGILWPSEGCALARSLCRCLRSCSRRSLTRCRWSRPPVRASSLSRARRQLCRRLTPRSRQRPRPRCRPRRRTPPHRTARLP
jgi:hypothetical protein